MIFRVSDALSEIGPLVEGAGVQITQPEGRRQALEVLNRATRELMNEGDWHGMTMEVCLAINEGTITLDERFETIRKAKWRYGNPLSIYGSGFKYLDPGMDPEEGGSLIPALVDQGDGYPTHRDLPRPMPIMAYSDAEECSDAVLDIRGIDKNGKENLFRLPIRHSWKSPEPPAMTGADRDFWSTGEWKYLQELRKPVTNGYVYVFGYDSMTGQMCWLTSIRPDIMSPCHRRYALPSGEKMRAQSINASVSFRWHPVFRDSDVLLIQNIDALRRMTQALHALDNGDSGSYQFFRNSAVSQLQKQLSKIHRPEKHALNVSMAQAPMKRRDYSFTRRSGAGRGSVSGGPAIIEKTSTKIIHIEKAAIGPPGETIAKPSVSRALAGDGSRVLFSHEDIELISMVFLNGQAIGDSGVSINGGNATFTTAPQPGDTVLIVGT